VLQLKPSNSIDQAIYLALYNLHCTVLSSPGGHTLTFGYLLCNQRMSMASRRPSGNGGESPPRDGDASSSSPAAAQSLQPSNDWVLAGVKASNEKLKSEIKKLKKDLDIERKNIKEIYVLHQGDLRQVRQQEQDRAQALVCDIKSKMNQEKQAELMKQKDRLVKAQEAEVLHMKKEHDENVWKLSTDKKKEKEQVVKSLWESKKTEDHKNAALQSELNKITQELHEVRSEKLKLEQELSSLTKVDKQKNMDLRRLAEEHERELQRIRNENRKDVKRIIEEMKNKEKMINIMQKEIGQQTGLTIQAELGKESADRLLEIARLNETKAESDESSKGHLVGEAGSKIPILHKRKIMSGHKMPSERTEEKELDLSFQSMSDEGSTSPKETNDDKVMSSSVEALPLELEISAIPEENQSTTPNQKNYSELTSVDQTSSKEEFSSLKRKSRIPVRSSTPMSSASMKSRSSTPGDPFSESEDHTIGEPHATSTPKGLEIVHPRSLSGIPRLSRSAMRGHLSSSELSIDSGCQSASGLGTSPIVRIEIEGLRKEIESYNPEQEEESAFMRKRRQRMSMSPAHKIPKIMTSSIDSIEEHDDIDVDAKEELIKVQADLQKQKDEMSRLQTVSLTNERLLREISALKERIFQLEDEKSSLNHRLEEVREENDDMEFRLLEIEQSRASPSKRKTPEYSKSVALSEEGVTIKCNRLSTKYKEGRISDEELTMMEKERHVEAIQIRLEELSQRLQKIKHSSSYDFTEEDVDALEMSRQAISLASKRIRSSNESISTMATTINELIDAQNCLQKENEDLQESRTIIPPEILRELEETKNELKEAQEELTTAKIALSDFKHLEMKWKQKFESQKKVEESYHDQVQDLKKRLGSAEMGRDYESQLWKEKLKEIQKKDLQINDLSVLVENLRAQLNEIAEIESNNLPDDVTKQYQKLVSDLQSHIEDCEAKEQNLLSEIERLKREDNEEIESLKNQCQQLEDRQMKLQEENESLNNNIDIYADQLSKSQHAVSNLKLQLVDLDVQLKKEQTHAAITDTLEQHKCCEKSRSTSIERDKTILEAQLSDMRKEMSVYEEKLHELRKENMSLNEDNKELTVSINEQKTTFEHEKETLKQEIHILHSRIRNKEDEIRDLTRELSPESEKANSLRRGTSFRRQKSRSRSPIKKTIPSPQPMEILEALEQLPVETIKEQLVREFEDRENQLRAESELALSDLGAQVKSLESKIELFRLKEISILERVQELEIREKDLVDQLKNYRLSPTEVDQLKEELEKVKEEKEQLLIKVKELENFLADKNMKFLKALDEKEAAENKLKTIQQKLSVMEDSEERNVDRIEELEKSQKSLMEKVRNNQELKEEAEILRHRLDELEGIRQTLQDQLWEFQQIERDLRDEIQHFNTNQINQDQMRMMEENISYLHISEKDLMNRNKELEHSERNLRNRLAPIEHLDPKIIDKMKNQILSLEKADKQLKKYIRELEDSQKCVTSENKELLVEADMLRKTVEELKSTENELLDKILELEEVENNLQQALVDKHHDDNEHEVIVESAMSMQNHVSELQLENSQLKCDHERCLVYFETELQKKEEQMKKEKDMKIKVLKDNILLQKEVECLQSDMERLKMTETELKNSSNIAQTNEKEFLAEIEILKSKNASMALKEDNLQSTLQKMEKSLGTAIQNADTEKLKVSELQVQLDEKMMLISEIQDLNFSLSKQVEANMHDIVDLKYVISEHQPRVALLKEKESLIEDLQKKNEFLQKEVEPYLGCSILERKSRTRSLDLTTALFNTNINAPAKPKEDAKKNEIEAQEGVKSSNSFSSLSSQDNDSLSSQTDNESQSSQTPPPLPKSAIPAIPNVPFQSPRSSTFIKDEDYSKAALSSENHCLIFPEVQLPVSVSPELIEYDISSDCTSFTSSSKSTSDIPTTVFTTAHISRPIYVYGKTTRRSTSLCTIDELRKKNSILTYYYESNHYPKLVGIDELVVAEMRPQSKCIPSVVCSTQTTVIATSCISTQTEVSRPSYQKAKTNRSTSMTCLPSDVVKFQTMPINSMERPLLHAERRSQFPKVDDNLKRKSRSLSIPACASVLPQPPDPLDRKRRKSSLTKASSPDNNPIFSKGVTPETESKQTPQQFGAQSSILERPEKRKSLDPENPLACCFFVDLNEKKTSCKKSVEPNNLGRKMTNPSEEKKTRRSENVKSASTPCMAPFLDEMPSSSLEADRRSKQFSAWDIPATSVSGKKRRVKSKRRNTQTISMEGAQVDSTQLYQAVCSYNPVLFSHSGRSTEELSLVEGDVVKPLSSVDNSGYLYAQVCGNKGLVPAAYLIPLNKAAAIETDLQQEAAQPSPPEPVPIVVHNSVSKLANSTSAAQVPEYGHPASPGKVYIQRVLSDLSVLLGWTLPKMDDFGYSNGTQVRGYKILINDKEIDEIFSPLQSKALIEGHFIPKDPYENYSPNYICFKVVTVSASGSQSAPSTCILEVSRDLSGSGAIVTPGEQPLTESESATSEAEAISDLNREFRFSTLRAASVTSLREEIATTTSPGDSLMTSSATSTASDGGRRRRPNRPPSPRLVVNL